MEESKETDKEVGRITKWRSKIRQFFSLNKESTKILQEFENDLKKNCFVSLLLNEIVESKLDKGNKPKQNLLLFFVVLIDIPLFGFQCLLYPASRHSNSVAIFP